ncbi:MAG TPA: methyltransferase domain-containing protein [Solirubrobacteraceae bacterium]|nr:methyltransferase domain-containing protein [Solirubrobacteraceae bacterium]
MSAAGEGQGDHWEELAAGWARHAGALREQFAPLTDALIAAADPQPGQSILELAAGLGDCGYRAAALIGATGRLIFSDRSEAMLAHAKARAAELGLDNVEHRRIDAEWIDMSVASIDAVICRFGLMLLEHPESMLRECRRVLRPGGRLALAVWDAQEANPWSAIPTALAAEQGLIVPAPAGAPGPFALGDQKRLRELIEGAGFLEVTITVVELCERHADFDSFFDRRLDLSRSFHDAVMGLAPEALGRLRAELEQRMAPYTDAAGALAVPGRALVAAAEA